jgi:hypothetical protein
MSRNALTVKALMDALSLLPDTAIIETTYEGVINYPTLEEFIFNTETNTLTIDAENGLAFSCKPRDYL